MARVPEEEINRIKTETGLKELVESYGVKLERKGKDWFGLCPFHDDHEPSLVVSPDKNLWNCLGACRSGGSPIDWVMRMEKVSFRHAVEKLKAGLKVESFKVESPEKKEAAKEEKNFPEDQGELLNQVVEFYHRTLKENGEALVSLAKMVSVLEI